MLHGLLVAMCVLAFQGTIFAYIYFGTIHDMKGKKLSDD